MRVICIRHDNRWTYDFTPRLIDVNESNKAITSIIGHKKYERPTVIDIYGGLYPRKYFIKMRVFQYVLGITSGFKVSNEIFNTT